MRRAYRASFWLASVVLGLSIMVSTLTATAGLQSPLDGVGDLHFIADAPVFWTASGKARVDLAVRIDHEEIQPAGRFGLLEWSRKVAVTFKLAREGIVLVDTTQVFRVLGTKRSPGTGTPFELLEISSPVTPGRWAATVEIRALGNHVHTARATGVLTVRDQSSTRPRLSDPEFRIRSRGFSLPHPQRMYGIVQDTLETYFELSGAEAGSRWWVGIEIVDPQYGSMDKQRIELVASERVAAARYELPLGSLPEGNYLIRMTPEWAPELLVESDFTLSWRIERAAQARDDVHIEAELLLSGDVLTRFKTLSRPAQSQVMQRFWDGHDPTPGTPRNELYERYQARVAHVERFYREGLVPGPLTDRGRIYVLYGPPSEIDVEVVPANGGDLEEAITQIHDAHAMNVEGDLAREALAEGDSDIDSGRDRITGLQRASRTTDRQTLLDRYRNQSRAGSEAAFELWRYDGRGDPLLEGAHAWSEDIGLRFLFVDRLGTGSYSMDFSNLSTRY